MPASIRTKNKTEPYEVIKVAPFRKEVRRTAPHKHNQYFEVVYLSSGSGDHWIDDQRYAVKAPVLFLINSGQVHNWDLHSSPDGHVLIIKHAFMEAAKDGQIRKLLQRLWSVDCIYLPREGKPEIEALFMLLEGRLCSSGDLDEMAVEGLLKTLLCRILMQIQSAANPFDPGSSLYMQYLDLLDRQNTVQRRVGYYAEKLGTTPQNLNAACRKAVNRSAGELIAEYILNEAKRLLLYTDNTVSQVAYQLEFTDPSYFIKFFKKHLHSTPEAFRKKAFSK